MTSEKQIEANWQNSQHSSGPKNFEKTRFNAVKHGILSKNFLDESEKKEFEEIFQELIESLNPENKIELRIVEKAARALWENKKIFNKERIDEYNYLIKAKIDKIDNNLFESSMFNSPENLAKIDVLKSKIKICPMPEEILLRYKNESDNQFYRAIKMLKELRTL